jgi:dihydrofolate reductase
MPRLRVHNFAISLDGYGAGPRQDRENPLGVCGLRLHEWIFPTRTFRRTIRQYLQARLIDELHLAVAPILLGSGEHLLAGIDLPTLGYACTEHVPTSSVTHVVLTRRG